MKFLVVLAVAIACVSADVSHIVKDESSAPIVKSDYEISPEGNFQYAYETGNGIYAQGQGVVKNANSEYPSLELQGGYRYTAPNGEPIEVSYVAGENGFEPQGSHLPVAPPTPEPILRALAYLAANPPPAEVVRAGPAPPKPAYG
ncbi:hypothetical protein PYW07_004704 [Mythimna separata]|uniref:Uncharacterized protein n=1 Tax=Mythimna separata TaxID=271217 RepID=A0AAD7YW78_MYTSE|nr:hypothetical protein PYW07_004704 [Mythimna separata]